MNEECAGGSASSICKSVNILLAIKWIKQAWEEVSPDTILNYFCYCGAIPDVEHQIETKLSDPFAELVAACNMHTLGDLVSQMDCGLTTNQTSAWTVSPGTRLLSSEQCLVMNLSLVLPHQSQS